MSLEKFRCWWKSEENGGGIICKLEGHPVAKEGFTLEEATQIESQITQEILNKIRKNIYIDSCHIPIELNKEKLYVKVSGSGFVELPFLMENRYGRTTDPSQIRDYRPLEN